MKTIDSIWQNTTKFQSKDINIYVFDNKSDLSQERCEMFYDLLRHDKIKHYSYDSNVSTYNCFGKAVVFQRWVKMMITEHEMYRTISPGLSHYKTFYLLVDNDMLLGPRWDEYFISAAERIESLEPDVHMLLKGPGGVPIQCKEKQPIHRMKNIYDDTLFSVQMGIGGGGSGFWFMTYNMLNKVLWKDMDLKYTFNVDKRHDSTTWRLIFDKYGVCRYNAAINPPDEDNPLVLHLGGRIGSICNKLVKHEYKGQIKEQLLISEEKEISNLSVNELWAKYKGVAGVW